MNGEKAIEILAKYKQALKAGKVVKLPCACGDKIYLTKTLFNLRKEPRGITVDYFIVTKTYTLMCCSNGEKYDADRVGKTIFKNYDEAMNAIKEGVQ